jgi:hypothetical protein
MLNAHWETIIPSMFYQIEGVEYERERLELDDGDFLDLDWMKKGTQRLMILSHGLEGNSERYYIKRTAKFFHERGWDILAWNNRSCSGEMNRLLRFYHHGATEDIAAVIEHALKKPYENIVLIGFSMGGGMQLKYLGEREVDPRVNGAVSISVPCHLLDSANALKQGFSKYYEKRFLNKLKLKILEKAKSMEIDTEGINEIKTFKQFDERYTLNMFPGFKDQTDFYNRISSLPYLPDIQVPVLILNAANDPMLINRCYPVKECAQNPNLHLEMPKYGGHVGFSLSGNEFSYIEYAAEKFIFDVILSPFGT